MTPGQWILLGAAVLYFVVNLVLAFLIDFARAMVECDEEVPPSAVDHFLDLLWWTLYAIPAIFIAIHRDALEATGANVSEFWRDLSIAMLACAVLGFATEGLLAALLMGIGAGLLGMILSFGVAEGEALRQQNNESPR